MTPVIKARRQTGVFPLVHACLARLLNGVAALAGAIIFLASADSFADTPQGVRDMDRASETYTDAAAAQAATEKVLSNLAGDYLRNWEAAVFGNLALYRVIVPSGADSPYWGSFVYSQPPTGTAGTWVGRISTNQPTVFAGQYQGLSGYRATYRIASVAALTNSSSGARSAFWQDVGLESIPVFEFALFYNVDLEMTPGVNWAISGRVHGNSNLWLMPSTNISLTFSNDVTASGLINLTNMPTDLDHTYVPNPNIAYLGEHSGGASALNLIMGGNNTSSNAFELLQIPPTAEDPNSPMGLNRFYNKADVIIIVSNTTVTVSSGVSVDNRATIIPTVQWTNFLVTNRVFYNAREQINITASQFDVGGFRAWAEAATNALKGRMAGKTTANIVYIADLRPASATNEPGVRVVNGSQLPNNGLTVASPNPVYIWGNYNITTNGASYSRFTNDTTFTYPASVLGDAITILSVAWADTAPLGASAASTTVNAALLAGIVPTSTNSYSGGFENFPRLLENWTGQSLWYNGSLVAMFASQTATAAWSGSGAYYSPPIRRWAFDKNFYQAQKLPPGTPLVGFVERLHQSIMDPNADPSQ